MKYTNLDILKELKHIKKCHEDVGNSGRDCMDNTADCIYNDNNTGILNFLSDKGMISMQESQYSGRVVPFIIPYGKDYLKRNNKITCFIADNQWSIHTLLGIMIAVIVGIFTYIITK